ncbi:hypothetical protein EI555_001771 [Monodon monoceros]|uniref:Gasdermin pore forming domain-containing protein n=1 Tax=Monodon monoceros TaxID=40151 RepID=A0A4U1F4U9_MONMO|nr:hypothetical protein EI555_001771 [Monodon monoceros]
MASAFARVVRSVVQELDHGGELTPVDSLQSSTSFQLYCLLGRKSSSSRFWKHRYTRVNLSIRDILEPDAPEPGTPLGTVRAMGRVGGGVGRPAATCSGPLGSCFQRAGTFQRPLCPGGKAADGGMGLSSGLAPAVECGNTFHFHDAMDGQLQGSVELAAPGQGKLAGRAAVSGSSSASMIVCTLRVAPNTWEAMRRERRLRRPEHQVLQQLRNRGDDVFVVTEVLQTQQEVEVTRTQKQEGSGQFALPGTMCLQGRGEGHLSQNKMVTIPAGSILAFRVAQLVIGSDWDSMAERQRGLEEPPGVTGGIWVGVAEGPLLWHLGDILFFPNKKQTTFRPQQEGYRPSYIAGGQLQRSSCLASTKFLPICFKFLSGQYLLGHPPGGLPFCPPVGSPGPCGYLGNGSPVPTDGPVEDRLATTEDFQGLQAEVEAWAVGLEGLSREPCGQLLGALGQVLRDEAALQALDESLEHGLRGGLLEPRDGPVGAVLECLVFSSRRLEKRLAGPVFYLLQALAVLSATQHVLLAEVLEMGALSGSFKLVESLLEQSTPWQERRAVSLPHELLGSSWGSEAPTWVLLEECGLEPQVGAPQGSSLVGAELMLPGATPSHVGSSPQDLGVEERQ